MEIKTIEQILDEVSKINGWDDFDSIHKKSTEKRNMIIAVNIAKKSAMAFEAQFQQNTDLITTEICVLRERVAELEGCLKDIHFQYFWNGNDLSTHYKDKIESLINKGKDNGI